MPTITIEDLAWVITGILIIAFYAWLAGALHRKQ